MNILNSKKCNCCKQLLSIDLFHKNKAFADGFSHYCKICRKNFYKKNLKAQEYDKNYSIKNKEKRKETVKKHYNKNKLKIAERKKIYYQLNKKKYSDKEKKRRENIQYKVKSNISRRIRSLLTGGKINKSTINFLGCSIEELKIFIEKKFREGMSWDNYGLKGWHLDHIKPCSSFDLTKEEDVKKCFHYTNLQPLWAKDNLSKGAKFPYFLNS